MMHHGTQPLSSAEQLARLQEHCHRDGDCLVWAGTVCSQGLPKVNWRGRCHSARRLLLGLAQGVPMSRCLFIWGTCEHEKTCMNRSHWKIGTCREHRRWLSARGRLRCGTVHAIDRARRAEATARLSMTRDAPTVARMLAQGDSRGVIAAHFGISRSYCDKAIRRWIEHGLIGAVTLREAA